jgi:uncharacterized alkaline shock family protein YloU
MATLHNPNDTVTVAPDVLVTVVRMAALGVEGVAHLASSSGGVDRWLKLSSDDHGVRLNVEDSGVRVDVYIIADASRSLYETSRRVQEEIAHTIKEYIGMKVLAVNVHIENVVFGN